MAVSKFTIELDLGNDAMRLPSHIAEALQAVIKQLPHVVMMKGARVKIKDCNGNLCGQFKYE